MTSERGADPALLLRQVREQVAGLLCDMAQVETPKRPLRIDDHQDGPLDVWAENESLSVYTMRDDDGPHAVYVAAGDRIPWPGNTALQWRPDWCALSVDEARTLGLALLGAAARAQIT